MIKNKTENLTKNWILSNFDEHITKQTIFPEQVCLPIM